MCGIWAYIGTNSPNPKPWLAALKGRGPEAQAYKEYPNGILGFTRLAINGLSDAGMQPFNWGKYAWICNGEIYNWRDLKARYDLPCESGSDCEIIGPLWDRLQDPVALCRALDGVFAFVLFDNETGAIVAGRDPYGVRPMFIGSSENGETIIASEMKAIVGLLDTITDDIEVFRPGCVLYAPNADSNGDVQQYHTVPWLKNPALDDYEAARTHVRSALEAAVKKRMLTTERPVAALLSGGVDSSLIAALVQREMTRLEICPSASGELRVLKGPDARLKTFSIGFEGSEDLRHARMVADWIGSDHTEVVMTADEFFAAIPEVVRTIESFDVTTVRASVGNYLVSREISRRCDAKVVFNGDGSDEVFGSYLYFYNAPSDEEFEAEVGRLLEDIHHFDVLRSDRSISSNGLEARTPFLDRQFVAVARSVATELRRPVRGECVEKQLLREAFAGTDLLPDAVLWRRKEAFSDGVSGKTKSWYEEIQERVTGFGLVPADWREQAARRFKYLTPETAEAYYYRDIFDCEYGCIAEKAATPYKWLPRWCGDARDPSARTLKVYQENTE